MAARRYGIIPHPSERQVLMVSTPDGWTLPAYEHREAREVNRDLHERFGIRVTILG